MNIVLPVRISGVDATGCQFDDEACTLDVSAAGARLSGIRRPLHRDSVVTVHRGPYQASYRVMWRGEEQGSEPGQIGVQLTENGSFIWGLVLRRQLAEIDGPSDEALSHAAAAAARVSAACADAAR